MKKFTTKNLKLVFIGLIIIAFALGSIFSLKLVKYSYFILIASVLLIINYFITSVALYKATKNFKSYITGFIGALILSIFFGIQSPQLPFKIYILGIGLLLIIIAIFKTLTH